MIKVKHITKEQFKKKFKLKELNPFSQGIFTKEDLQKIQEDFGIIGVSKKLTTIPELIKIARQEPLRVTTNIPRLFLVHLSGLLQYYSSKAKSTKDSYPFSDYVLKASIIAMVSPKRLLEIGTARGWGIAAFKSVLPECACYTMSPKNTSGANNELPTKEIGSAFKSKGLKVTQIWSDSTKFDYDSFPLVDVSYIDGNHRYQFVYSDLINAHKITKKMIILDDYIPSPSSPRGHVLNWGWWNRDVVAATNDFLKKYPKVIKEAYWIENTPICVLLKKTYVK